MYQEVEIEDEIQSAEEEIDARAHMHGKSFVL